MFTAESKPIDNRWPRGARLPFCAAALTLLAIGVWLVPGAANWLQYDRAAIAAGEAWRAITGHVTHWNADHLLWDALMFAVLGALIERSSRRAFVTVTLLSALAISATLWFAQPAIDRYRGLSGIDSALFVFQACWLVREGFHERRHAAAIVPTVALVGFAAKIGYELATGATLFVDSAAAGFAPLPLAHVIGGAVGLLVLGALVVSRRLANWQRSCYGSDLSASLRS